MERSREASRHVVSGLLIVAVLAVVSGTGGSLARAAVETYSVDASHSSVGFMIAHFFSRVPGRFTGLEGTITVDPDDLSTGSVRMVIDAGSIDTADADRDTHLRSADFFDVKHYPSITFESSEVRAAGENMAMVDGTLTLRGVSRPVTLEIEFLGSGPDLWGGHRSGFEARTTINRKEFGMIWNEALDSGRFVLGDEVSILINIEGLRQDGSVEGDSAAEEESASDEPPPVEGGTPVEEEPTTEGEPPADEETPVEGEAEDPDPAEPTQQ